MRVVAGQQSSERRPSKVTPVAFPDIKLLHIDWLMFQNDDIGLSIIGSGLV